MAGCMGIDLDCLVTNRLAAAVQVLCLIWRQWWQRGTAGGPEELFVHSTLLKGGQHQCVKEYRPV